MKVSDFLKECDRRGISISLDGGALSIHPDTLPDKTVNYIRSHKPEIVTELSKPNASQLACLLQLPDKRQFWMAPDGMKFDSRDIPIIRRSVLDKMIQSGADIQTEIMRLIDGLHILGGEVFIKGATPLPDTQKAVTSDLRRSDHG